jgi:hypothetical protein
MSASDERGWSRDRLFEETRVLARSLGTVVCVEAEDGAALALAVDGGEEVELRIEGELVDVAFAGWSERIGALDGGEDDVDLCELALDLIAASLLGEVRVIEEAAGEEILRRAFEVRVGGLWRVHARRGGLGLRGLWARLRRGLVRRVRANDGTLRRRGRMQGAGPSGHPAALWAGAAGRSGGDAASIEIDGELDLHNFSPKEVKPLVREYIEVCRGRGIYELRIIHGKGKGVLRRTVHSLLERHPAVQDFRLGGHGEGSWGATMVTLRPPSSAPPEP